MTTTDIRNRHSNAILTIEESQNDMELAPQRASGGASKPLKSLLFGFATRDRWAGAGKLVCGRSYRDRR